MAHASNEVSGTRMPHFKTGVFGLIIAWGCIFDKSQNAPQPLGILETL